ncbi:MAG: hypothetical protein ACXACG_10280 [Candidatus Thorarchaeota archaeon]|jgi:hypothetical protein
MRTETAQRILWFAMIFIIIAIIVTAFAGLAFAAVIAFEVDLGSFITDPTILAFIGDYPGFLPFVIWVFCGLEIIYLLIIYMWRKDPGAHRTGFTIVGILNLLMGFSLPGLLILLPGLLMEDTQ